MQKLIALAKMDSTATAESTARLLRTNFIEMVGSRLRATEKARAVRSVADPLSSEMQELFLSVLDPAKRDEVKQTTAVLLSWLRSQEFHAKLAARYPEIRSGTAAQ